MGRLSENVYTFKADVCDNKARLVCQASSVINNTRLTTEVNLIVYCKYHTLFIELYESKVEKVGESGTLGVYY